VKVEKLVKNGEKGQNSQPLSPNVCEMEYILGRDEAQRGV
jgi:hypothetical protein